MRHIRWQLGYRGVDRQFVMTLMVAIVAAWAATHVTVELRSPADRLIEAPVLDSAVVIGLVLPIAVMARTLQNRLAWLTETSPRTPMKHRAVWLIILTVSASVIAGSIAVLAPPQLLSGLMIIDFFLLLGLAVWGAVLFGASLAWLPPTIVALLASTPGIVPVGLNVLANGATQRVAVALAITVLASGCVAYLALDDYGIRRRSRLIERSPGVTEE